MIHRFVAGVRILFNAKRSPDPAGALAAGNVEHERVNAENVSFIFELANARLMDQMGRVDRFNDRAIATISFGAGLIPATYGLMLVGGNLRISDPWVWVPLSLAIFSFGGVILFGARVFRRRHWDMNPPMHDLRMHQDTLSLAELQSWTTRAIVQGVIDNEPKLSKKGNDAYKMQVAALFEVSLLAAGATVAIVKIYW